MDDILTKVADAGLVSSSDGGFRLPLADGQECDVSIERTGDGLRKPDAFERFCFATSKSADIPIERVSKEMPSFARLVLRLRRRAK